MEIHINKISKKLRNLREEHNLTQEELAKDLGVSRQSIISLEQGRCLPSLPLAISFSRVFELPFEEIFIEEIEQIHRDVENLLSDDEDFESPHQIRTQNFVIDNMFEENRGQTNESIFPRMNILNNERDIVITADLPGVSEEDLVIEAGGESLIIKGERNLENEDEKGNFYHHEIQSGNFLRTIPLPSRIVKEKTEAKLKDGVLKIILPKELKPEPKITKIKIQRG